MVKLQVRAITKEFIEKVVAFSVAECGAMGNFENIVFLTEDQELFEMTCRDIATQKELAKIFPACGLCIEYIQGKRKATKGWTWTYLGSGNHLFMTDWMDALFYEIMKEPDEVEVNLTWINIMMQILDGKKNKNGQ